MQGYRGKALELLDRCNAKVGDQVKIKLDDKSFEGILMPRYEFADDKHIVIKLSNGYNVGIDIDKINSIEVLESKVMKSARKIEHKVRGDLPRIAMISTGGTIASKIDYRTGGVKAILSAEELYNAVPELSNIANIEPEVLFNEYSENLTYEHWKAIAEKVYEKRDYDGIIITHGTDTMHYTASALSFALKINIPIVLVGAQRSSDRPSSDAATNLIAATLFASKTDLTGVFVAMHDNLSDNLISIHLGTRVRKCHTSRRDAFRSIGIKPIAYVKDGREIIYNDRSLPKRGEVREYIKPSFAKVSLLKYYPSMDANIIKYLADDSKGIVIEGTGLGHVGKTLFNAIEDAINKNVIICMTSQCIEGRVRMTVYETGRDLLRLGVIPLEDMLAETAFTKLSWALANYDHDQVKDIMLENISREMNERSIIG
ncbi:MAG: glutamyl-tRNA(Gln) amidotransferase subunit D [Candidatus Nitrosocaldaceae archaeon]|nr:MAG: glutamyl-tRNA(Gln) amidotransferase subunit D [Candidatus Nitrosocaldaceae archaeon]